MKKPSEFEKRILVAVSGLSPAILTETLYAAAVASKEDKFIPTEVHLLTTLEGKTRAQNALLKGSNAAFIKLCKDYDLGHIDFSPTNIHVIPDSEGTPLADIRQPQDNEAAADFIVDKIRELTSDDNSAVHVSIAGGRKTMGYYVGYALSLFGREQDRLSHVLVDADYETCTDFFYPTQETVISNNRDGKPIDFAEANVYLAEIPFVRMRHHLPERVTKHDKLIKGERTFSKTVQLIQKASEPFSLKIHVADRLVTLNGVEEKWSKGNIYLAYYLWMIEQNLEEGLSPSCPEPGVPNMEYAESFMEIYTMICNREEIGSTEEGLRLGMDKSFFTDKKSSVNKQLIDMFGEELASKAMIHTFGKKGATKYRVEFKEDEVTILMPSQTASHGDDVNSAMNDFLSKKK